MRTRASRLFPQPSQIADMITTALELAAITTFIIGIALLCAAATGTGQ